MKSTAIWLWAIVAALVIAAAPTLMGEPSDIELIQATADDVTQAIASARAAHPGARE